MNQFMTNCPITRRNQAPNLPFLYEQDHRDQPTEEGQPVSLAAFQQIHEKEMAEEDITIKGPRHRVSGLPTSQKDAHGTSLPLNERVHLLLHSYQRDWT